MAAGDWRNNSDKRKIAAAHFFELARQYESNSEFYKAIESCFMALQLEPDDVAGHKALRVLALRRLAAGGKLLGFWDRFRLRRMTTDPISNMLAKEKLWAFDPGNTDHMLSFVQAARAGGFEATAAWAESILRRAIRDTDARHDKAKQ